MTSLLTGCAGCTRVPLLGAVAAASAGCAWHSPPPVPAGQMLRCSTHRPGCQPVQPSHALHSKLAKHKFCCRQLRDTAAPGKGSTAQPSTSTLDPQPLTRLGSKACCHQPPHQPQGSAIIALTAPLVTGMLSWTSRGACLSPAATWLPARPYTGLAGLPGSSCHSTALLAAPFTAVPWPCAAWRSPPAAAARAQGGPWPFRPAAGLPADPVGFGPSAPAALPCPAAAAAGAEGCPGPARRAAGLPAPPVVFCPEPGPPPSSSRAACGPERPWRLLNKASNRAKCCSR